MIKIYLIWIGLIILSDKNNKCSAFFLNEKLYFNLNKIKYKDIVLEVDQFEFKIRACTPVSHFKNCDSNNSLGIIRNKNTGECYYLSDELTEFIYDYKLEKNTESKNRFYLTRSNKEKSTKKNIVDFEMNIHCTDDEEINLIPELDIEKLKLKLKIYTKKVCGYTLDPVEKFKKYKYILFIIFLVVGFILCFLGTKFANFAMYILGFLTTSLISITFLAVVLSNVEQDKKLLLFIGFLLITLVSGYLLGIIFTKTKFVLSVISSLLIGYIISLLLFFFLFERILYLHLIAGITAIFLFILNISNYKFFKIFNLAVIGGYLIGVNSMSFFPEYLREYTLIKLIIDKQYKDISIYNYVSWWIFIICTFLGLFFQLYFRKNEKKNVKIDEFDWYINNKYKKHKNKN